MRYGQALFLAAVVGSIPAGSGHLAAQACIGLPQGTAGALNLSFAFPEDATSYGLSGAVASAESGLFFQGGFALTSYDVPGLESLDNETTVDGGIAFEVSSLAPGVSLCPLVGAAYSWLEDLNSLSIPFGVGVGATLPVGRTGGAGLTPYIIPQFLHSRLSIDDLDGTESDTYFGLQAGMTLNAGALILGAAVNKIFEEDTDEVFGIFVGAAWP